MVEVFGPDAVVVDVEWKKAHIGPACKHGDHMQDECIGHGCGCLCHNLNNK